MPGLLDNRTCIVDPERVAEADTQLLIITTLHAELESQQTRHQEQLRQVMGLVTQASEAAAQHRERATALEAEVLAQTEQATLASEQATDLATELASVLTKQQATQAPPPRKLAPPLTGKEKRAAQQKERAAMQPITSSLRSRRRKCASGPVEVSPFGHLN